ncbi:MAG: acyl-CoA thioesterase [Bacteroidales bacterium]|nr:acyl-CoA thioesterase [Bacteroidales bacterium]
MATPKEPAHYIFEMPMRVRDYEVDAQGIVNNANYLHYLEHTRHEFCRMAGMTFAEMHRQGIDPVLRRVEIIYLHSLGLGEEMVSKLNIRRDGARFIFQQDIFKHPGGEPVVRAEVTIVCIENGRLGRGDVLADVFDRFLH